MLTLKATTPQLQQQARSLWQQIENAAPTSLSFLPTVDVDAFRRYAEYYDKQVETLALDLSTGKITVNQWRRSMESEIDRLHVTAAVIGRGGLDGMNQRDLKTVRRKIGEQKQYLQAWEGELLQQRNREEEFDPAKIYNRARLYGGAANATVNEARVTSTGLPALPQYPGDGHTQCRTNCKCSLRFDRLKGEGDFDIYWELHPAEHCDDCKLLAQQWNPLRVRKWQIQ
jgi:hypothetical protein